MTELAEWPVLTSVWPHVLLCSPLAKTKLGTIDAEGEGFHEVYVEM